AQQSLEAAVNIYRDLPDNEQEFQALSRLITAYEKLGDAQNIKVALQRQAVLAEAMQDPLALRRVGIEFQCVEQWDAALATDQKALTIYRRNRPDDSSPTNSFTVDMELATLANMSQTLIKANRFAEAEQTLLTALDLLDSVLAAPIPELQGDDVELDEQISRFADYYTSPVSSNNLYLMLQRVLIAQGRTDEALVIAERGRTQALEEVWAIKQAGARLPEFALADIQAIARSQNATVVTYSFDTLVDRCSGDLTSPELLTWVIQPTGDIHFHNQPIEFSAIATEPDDISNLVQGTRTSLGARGLTIVAANPESVPAPPVQNQPYLQVLHRLLVEPIEPYLSNNPNDRIIFVPDFVLFMAPFPALQDDEGRYLIEKHTLSSAPSIQALALTAQARQRSLPARANPLVVGNPIYAPISLLGRPPITLPPLPGAEQEALKIADLLGTEPLVRADATKQAILETIEDASLLHFATHGFLDGVALDTPGAIAVAQSQDDASVVLEYPNFIRYLSDDGLIRTQEILSFRLQANLVVLSACNTGGGELTGDGVTGLSRAFIASGVPSVIVSLWAVPDAPTGELMTTFYEEWLAGADKASALRLAMLDTLEKYPNPVNWAAFTLIGETQ
ncbi:MAG: CHAT domain-containing protein, partial [Cyanobacteria bacterium P01_H01_bin.58]